MTTALYRRYRPEAFGEMIGQSQVTEPLMQAKLSALDAAMYNGIGSCRGLGVTMTSGTW